MASANLAIAKESAQIALLDRLATASNLPTIKAYAEAYSLITYPPANPTIGSSQN